MRSQLMCMNPLEIIFEAFGMDMGLIEWFGLTVAAYFIFGFGSCVFDRRAWRFRDTSTGRFIKWESALIFGTIGDVLIIYGLYNTMDFLDKISSIFGLLICITLTVIFGRSTRKY